MMMMAVHQCIASQLSRPAAMCVAVNRPLRFLLNHKHANCLNARHSLSQTTVTMPKPTQASGKSGTLFSVSPWQSKSDHKASEEDQAPGEQEYTVIEQDIFQKPDPIPPSTTTSQPRLNQPTAINTDNVPWKTKPTKTALDEEHIPLLETLEPLIHASGIDTVNDDTTLHDTNNTNTDLSTILNGTAYLAILPEEGSLTGHFIVDSVNKQSLGLMGTEVLSYRECTRDEEWRVLRLTVVNFQDNKEVTLLVSSTGGDALKLESPIDWQGMEEEVANELGAGCCDDVVLEFECDQILEGASADNVLRAIKPSLAGQQEVLVNVGTMSLHLPHRLNWESWND